MDPVLLSRIQFALTISFHFLFPSISIGLAWLLVVAEWKGWRRNDESWQRVGKFFGKIFALTFVVGVASGIVMEFQFGTNWAEYSKFVGDIFGAPLAAEGVIAFFLESGFLGLYLFGRGRVGKGWHWFSILMVAVGATISAFWILVANSWQQTPAGYVLANGRAELTSFYEAVFNPSTIHRFLHTMMATLVCGSFFMAGIAAYLLRKNSNDPVARRALKLAIIVGLPASVLVAFPTGHHHAQQVARTQPAKFAAIEGLYESSPGKAPLVLFAVPQEKPPELKAKVEITGLLSWMAFGDINAPVKGLDQIPADERPPLWLTFVPFHNMVILGGAFIMLMAWAAWCWRGDTLWTSRRFLLLLIFAIPLPHFAIQFGWVTAEVGRQPWIVQGLLRTRDGISVTVPWEQMLASLLLLVLIELSLLGLYFFLLVKKVKAGPEGAQI
jgi:cytochrome d ubiquinol oxidase subunit I